jgi:hypothetical protein
MTKFRIKIIGCGSGEPTEFDGKWLSEYDPEKQGYDSAGRPMIAHLKAVSDPAKALGFDDPKDALELWRKTDGTRPDGKPNRPLTAFTVEFIKA